MTSRSMPLAVAPRLLLPHW